jgi:hypothetical protein
MIQKVEPLGERAWATIETRVFDEVARRRAQPAPRARHGLTLGLASLSLAASLLALVQGLRPDLDAPRGNDASEISNEAPRARGARLAVERVESPDPSTSDSEVPYLEYIETTKVPREALLGASRLLISKRSSLAITGSDQLGWKVSLERGEVNFQVAPRQRRPDFLVKSGGVLVRVVGTRFNVGKSASGTTVSVEEGRVLVEKDGHVTTLDPGDHWSERDQAETEAESRAPRRREARRTETRTRKKRSRAPRSKPVDASQRFNEAASLEARNPGRALAIYERLSESPGSWAAPALYARGRLLFDQKRMTEARRIFKRYESRYPSGDNVADVARLLRKIDGRTSE